MLRFTFCVTLERAGYTHTRTRADTHAPRDLWMSPTVSALTEIQPTRGNQERGFLLLLSFGQERPPFFVVVVLIPFTPFFVATVLVGTSSRIGFWMNLSSFV